MAQPGTKKHVMNRLASTPSKQSSVAALVSDFKELAAANGATLSSVLNAVSSRNWTAARTSMASLTQTEAFKSLAETARSEGFRSIGPIGGIDFGLVLGGKGAAGILTGVTSFSRFYSYEGIGVSLGLTEGVALGGGLYLSTESPGEAGGTEFFGEVSGDIGVGAAAEAFHSLTGGNGLLIFLATGEELEISGGVGYAWVEEL